MKGLILGLLLISGSIVSGQDRFVLDKPQYNGLAKALAYMNASGFLHSTEITSGLMGHFNVTRHAMASTVIKATPRLEAYVRNEQKYPPMPDDELRHLHDRRGLYASGIYDTWAMMLREFEPEIKKLGVSPALLWKQLERCKPILTSLADQFDYAVLSRGGAPRFADVSFGHWAERDIQELRDAGILVGYPDGRFHGSPKLSK